MICVTVDKCVELTESVEVFFMHKLRENITYYDIVRRVF